MPTPGPELKDALKNGKRIDDCNISVAPQWSSEYQDYRRSAFSWAAHYIDKLSTCPGFKENMSLMPTQCFTQGAATQGLPTGTSSENGSNKSSLASRELGSGLAAMVAVAVALVAP
ncbi:hypothetical protein QQS21_002011 [Conoideocrella luteorostrata]|uniref:Uncharacterized protein n=1 Tax=Conoideocrella luteorostrata TaxID=1105319 RepID=A0AAJ0G368_9HYPO|nr:hypothetical protein QQS21_002011 [Conoideocrella luteorostrata]